jgi:hypothetical protein
MVKTFLIKVVKDLGDALKNLTIKIMVYLKQKTCRHTSTKTDTAVREEPLEIRSTTTCKDCGAGCRPAGPNSEYFIQQHHQEILK